MCNGYYETALIAGAKPEGMADASRALRKRQTHAEEVLWQNLRANRLNGLHFRRQQPIDRFIVDFYCHKARLAVELDGSVHIGRTSADIEREKLLSRHGVIVVRWTNHQVLNQTESILHCLADIAQSRIAELSK